MNVTQRLSEIQIEIEEIEYALVPEKGDEYDVPTDVERRWTLEAELTALILERERLLVGPARNGDFA